jgi:hypothetical protein
VILVSCGHAGICILCVLISILSNYSAHVSNISLAISSSSSDRSALSYALWERKRIIVAVTFAIWFGNTATFVYSLFLFLPSPDTGSQDLLSADVYSQTWPYLVHSRS